MPELPEVETIKNALTTHLKGKHFIKIETFIDSCRYSLEPLLDPELLNSEIIDLRRRARYLIIELSNRRVLIIHFGMSGSIRVVPENIKREKHEHVIFNISDGNTMRFDCPRRFGFIKTGKLKIPGTDPEELSELGLEPLSEDFTGKYLKSRFEGKNRKIKTAIMDNLIVVGVGNIYANESLFLAGISPVTPVGKLSRRQCDELVKHIKETLAKAIKAGGTTIADFKSVDGSEGRFVQQLNVYGKDGEKCPRCGKHIHKEVIGGRSSFHCRKCQK